MATPKIEPSVTSRSQEQDDLELAFEIIADAIKKGHRFTNAQKDMGVMLSFNAMNEEQQKFLVEAAESRGAPLWMALYAQWERSIEWGCVFDLLIRPEWEEMKESK